MMKHLTDHNEAVQKESVRRAYQKTWAGVLCDQCGEQMSWLEMGDVPIGEDWHRSERKVICRKCGFQGKKLDDSSDILRGDLLTRKELQREIEDDEDDTAE